MVASRETPRISGDLCRRLEVSCSEARLDVTGGELEVGDLDSDAHWDSMGLADTTVRQLQQ
jgi:hypothetical protein